MDQISYNIILENTHSFFLGTEKNTLNNISKDPNFNLRHISQLERDYPVYFFMGIESELDIFNKTKTAIEGLDSLIDDKNEYGDKELDILGNRIFALTQKIYNEEPLYLREIWEINQYIQLLKGKFKYILKV